MNKEDLPVLEQLIESLEKYNVEFEKAYNEKDSKNLILIKKRILEIQNKISQIVK